MKDKNKTVQTKCVKCGKPFSYNPDDPHDWCRECAAKQRERKKKELVLTCKDCGKEFYVTAGEAEYLRSKGFDMPKRCWDCRQKRKAEREQQAQQEAQE